jgi:hypothetical protein
VSADDRLWQAGTAESGPATSLARVDDRVRQVVTSVSLVGSLIVGVGLVASGRVDRSSPARVLAVASVCVALVAVVLGLGLLLLRAIPVRPSPSPAKVPAWHRRQYRWAYGGIVSGVLLLLAVLLGGASAVVVLVGGPGAEPTTPDSTMSVQLVGSGAEARLTVRADFTGVAAGQVLHIEVVGQDPSGSQTLLARGVAAAGRSGVVSATVEVARLGELYRSVQVSAAVAAQRCTATLIPGGDPAPATLVCTLR